MTIWLILLGHNPSQGDVRTRTQVGSEAETMALLYRYALWCSGQCIRFLALLQSQDHLELATAEPSHILIDMTTGQSD